MAEDAAKAWAREDRWQNGACAIDHQVLVCGPQTGHAYRVVAMCENTEYATDIFIAINACGAMRGTLEMVRDHIAQNTIALIKFGIPVPYIRTEIDKALAKAEGQS